MVGVTEAAADGACADHLFAEVAAGAADGAADCTADGGAGSGAGWADDTAAECAEGFADGSASGGAAGAGDHATGNFLPGFGALTGGLGELAEFLIHGVDGGAEVFVAMGHVDCVCSSEGAWLVVVGVDRGGGGCVGVLSGFGVLVGVLRVSVEG